MDWVMEKDEGCQDNAGRPFVLYRFCNGSVIALDLLPMTKHHNSLLRRVHHAVLLFGSTVFKQQKGRMNVVGGD